MRASALLLAAATLTASTATQAQEIPDLRGDWTGKTVTIVAGAGGHWQSSKGTFDRPALLEKEVMWQVIGQQDRRFWGISRLKGAKEDTSEPFVAELDTSLRRIVMADSDGYFWGELQGADSISYCYANPGGRTGAAVVSCNELQRKR